MGLLVGRSKFGQPEIEFLTVALALYVGNDVFMVVSFLAKLQVPHRPSFIARRPCCRSFWT
jgi:hypothetical protein